MNKGTELIKKAYSSLNKGRFDEALKYFNEVLKYGEIPAVLNDKGFVLNELKRYDEALVCFNKVLNLENNILSEIYINAWYNKARSFIGLNMFEEALQCFNIVLDLNPNHANAKVGKNLILKRDCDLDV